MGNPHRVEHEARHQLMAGCDQNCRTTDESSDGSKTRYDRRTNGAWRLPLDRIGILQQGIGDHEQSEARVRQDIEPNRTLEAGAQTACWRYYVWKCERPRNCDERRQEIAICQGEERARAQD